MFEIQTPFSIKGLPLKPELSGRQKVDETLIQTLSALMAFDGESRRLLTCALGGSLNSVSPPVAGIQNLLSTGAQEDWVGGDIPTTEVMMQSKTTNTDNIFVNVGALAANNTGWLLKPGDILKISINNMNQLNIFFKSTAHWLDLIRTV